MRWRAERWAALAGAGLLSACGGGVHGLVQDSPVKLGRPYQVAGRTYVPADDPGYDRIGEASWYGDVEQGRRTANGEKFYRQRVSAAHTTLPLPSYVEVTRLDTGQRILVRVNDRGPYARDRILDLSQEAARQIGIDRAGRAMVRVRRVTPSRHDAERLRRGYPVELSRVTPTATPPRVGHVAPAQAPLVQRPAARPMSPSLSAPLWPPRPAPAAPMAVPQPAPNRIVVATPADPDAADALATSLASEGAHVEATGGGYRVVTEPYPDAASLSAALARLRLRGYQGAAVQQTPEPNGITNP
jgi:rare lipoprotein A